MSAKHIFYFAVEILNFTLFQDSPEFFARYEILNVKSHKPYDNLLDIRILDLTMLDKLSESEQELYKDLVKWARIFRAQTMSELEEIVAGEEELKEMTLVLAELSEDEKIRQECERRIDGERIRAKYRLM